MTLEFHPAVQRDFNAAIDYYAAEGGGHLANRFETELRDCLAAIKSGPRHFAFYQGSTAFRRIRFRNFPYLVVYREKVDVVRVTILKHEKRHPRFGTPSKTSWRWTFPLRGGEEAYLAYDVGPFPPGAYTIHVRDASEKGGAALLEAYEVP